ncbi:MAG: chemotaxis protein CheA [Verrucomicrobiota bacterium]
MSDADPQESSFLETKLQQIAAEIAMLSPGSDEGLIPLFALSGEILEHPKLEEPWVRPIEALQTLLDTFLDEGRPVDEEGMRQFALFNEWLNGAIIRSATNAPLEALPPGLALDEESTSTAPGPVAESAADNEPASPLEADLRRIGGELGMLTSGSDEGLIPLFSLSSDLLDNPELPEEWARALERLQAELSTYLDRGLAMDDAGLARFQTFGAWARQAVDCYRAGAPLPAPPTLSPAATSKSSPAASDIAEYAPAALAAAPARNGPAPTSTEAAVQEDEEILVVDTSDDMSLLQEFFQESMEHLDSIEGHLLTLEASPQDSEGLAAVFRAFHSVKGVAGFLQLKPIQRLAHQVESLLDLARNHKLVLNSPLITLILESCDQLKAMTNLVGVALEKGSVKDARFPIAELVRRIETTTIATQNGSLDAIDTAGPERPAPSADAAAGFNDAGNQGQAKARTIRVATERINNLMDVVGELVILESQLRQTAKPHMSGNTAMQRQFSQLQRILKDLQHTSMALQMVPIRPTFQRVERIVRDLSQKFEKQIELHISGEETELDRTVVEIITDPLVHMIRNAVDHGLETPAERTKAGKHPTGRIDLKAYHLDSSIVIELVDDGRGIDPEKIRAKAIEKGIIAAETPLSRDEILQLIFAAGFSTAAVLTENSGRGVGMDVVKRNIESMRGTVTIISEVGKGSTFKIKLPLTTAIIDGLIVRVGDEKYIIPTHTVNVTLRPEKKQITRIAGQREMLIMRDKTVPLVRLNQFLGLQHGESDPTKAALAIVDSFGKQYAIMVDEMINKQEVVIKSLGSVVGHLPGIAGGAILGDGSIALILDPAALARHQVA